MTASVPIGVMFRREQHPASLVDYARRVEAMGFDHLWVVEDCFYMGGLTQAAIALAVTERITVGVGINPAVARNAAFLAMEYATLANAFPGRVIGGVGHGVAAWMDQVGARPTSWLCSIEEITLAVRHILRGETVTTQGDYVRLDRVMLHQPPKHVPPVLLGVRGEKSLRLAGSVAEGALLAEGSPPAYVRWAIERMREGRAHAKRDEAIETIVYAISLVDAGDPDAARHHARVMLAGVFADGVPASVAQSPYADDMAQMIREGGEQALGAGMPDAWVNDLAITGTPDDAIAAVSNYVAAGATGIVLVPPDEADVDAWLEQQAWAVSL